MGGSSDEDLTIPAFLQRGHPDNDWLVNAPVHHEIKPTAGTRERDERWEHYKKEHAEQKKAKRKASVRKMLDEHPGQKYDRKQRRWVDAKANAERADDADE